jgi:hypothetical protein
MSSPSGDAIGYGSQQGPTVNTLAIAAVVVVTQTLVEVCGMLIYIRAVSRLAPAATS